jgi:RimJ/RimL family protein N-acetyltransferase
MYIYIALHFMQNLKSLLFNGHSKESFLLNRLGKNFATWYDGKNPYTIHLQNKEYGKIYMAPLNPESQEDFEAFKTIVSNPKVAMTSSWMDSVFGLENLERLIKNSKEPENEIKKLLDNPKYSENVRNIYTNLTKHNKDYQLGYCGVYGDGGELLGGCGIVPTAVKNGRISSCDVSLHILPKYQKSGLGTGLMRRMLEYAFDEQAVPEIVGSSMKKHMGTPLVCARFGFLMEDIGNHKHYLLDSSMWRTNQSAMQKIKNLHVASDFFKAESQVSKMNVDSLKDDNTSNLEEKPVFQSKESTSSKAKDISKNATPHNSL